MKKDITTIVIGILFLFAGIAIGGSMLGFFDFTINFAGWWTLFLIIPSLLAIIQGGFNTGNIILLCVGVVLLLNAQEVLPYNFSWKMILPIVLLIVGFQLLFGNRNGSGSAGRWTGRRSGRTDGSCGSDKTGTTATGAAETAAGTSAGSSTGTSASYKTASVLFGGQDIRYGSEEFSGGTYTAIFGGFTVNLRNVTLVGDVVITVTALFGGIDLILPDNVQVISNIIPILGGAECKYVSSCDPHAPKIIINGNVSFGGIDIK